MSIINAIAKKVLYSSSLELLRFRFQTKLLRYSLLLFFSSSLLLFFSSSLLLFFSSSLLLSSASASASASFAFLFIFSNDVHLLFFHSFKSVTTITFPALTLSARMLRARYYLYLFIYIYLFIFIYLFLALFLYLTNNLSLIFQVSFEITTDITGPIYLYYKV